MVGRGMLAKRVVKIERRHRARMRKKLSGRENLRR